ncbi:MULTISPECIES: restriction endonuclease [unclassified Sphingobacterium]|uniref:restriction endonuclease n=1 Tax=unclassified Sphingobacterium TaxID=2609468 RepID=UPI0025E37980|nr:MULTISPECIES: restriction endonuclease [unclassified Sphingobacterium]
MSETSKINWQDYEAITKYVYESLGAQYGIKILGYGNTCKLSGKSGVTHQIDVLTEQFDGKKSIRTAIECKYCKEKANKDIVMKLSETMLDLGIEKGIIVCKSGFTKDTIMYAEHKGIKLVKLWEAGESDTDYKKDIELGTLDIRLNITRTCANITSITFGDKTIQFDPLIGAAYLFKLRDACGREVNLQPYLLKFASEVTNRREVLKNITLDYLTDRKLFLDVENGVLAIEKFSVTGFLTIDDLSTKKYFTLTDQVWMIMEELFDKRRLSLSKSGLIWSDRENDDNI